MTYNWDSSLETGNSTIDKQHKELIAKINEITVAHREGKGIDEIAKTMDFLSDYTVLHFTAEEKLMNECSYPELANHKRFHDEFKETMKNLTKRMVNETSPEDFVTTVIQTLGDWLYNHIKGDDIRMAAFTKTICKTENN